MTRDEAGRLGVQRARGLVEEDHRGPGGEERREDHALRLAARELGSATAQQRGVEVRVARGVEGEPAEVRAIGGPAGRLADVVERGARGVEGARRILRPVPHDASAEEAGAGRGEGIHAVDADGPRRDRGPGGEVPEERVKEGRLPAA